MNGIPKSFRGELSFAAAISGDKLEGSPLCLAASKDLADQLERNISEKSLFLRIDGISAQAAVSIYFFLTYSTQGSEPRKIEECANRETILKEMKRPNGKIYRMTRKNANHTHIVEIFGLPNPSEEDS